MLLATKCREMTFDPDGDANLPAVRLYRNIHPVFEAVTESLGVCESALRDASFVEGRRARANERPILGNCEAELLHSGHFDEDYVLKNLVDRRGAPSLDKLYSRWKSPAELTTVVVKPWRDD